MMTRLPTRNSCSATLVSSVGPRFSLPQDLVAAEQDLNQLLADLVDGGVHPPDHPVMHEPVDRADEGGGGDAVVARRHLPTAGGLVGEPADQLDPAGPALEALVVDAGADPDDLDVRDPGAARVGGRAPH